MSFPFATTEGPQNTSNWQYLSGYFIVGKGNPEKVINAAVGAIYMREDGEAGKTFYVKESGEGTNEGWVALESGSKEGGFATIKELVEEAEKRLAADTAEKGAREAAVTAEKEAREAGDNERVKGPGSSTESDIVVFSGTTGKIIKDGGKTIAEVLNRSNHTGTQLASTISNFDTQVRTSTLNQMTAPTADLSINEHKLTKVLDPTENLDAANKEYVDAAASAAAAGLSLKNPVAYATTAALTVTKATEKTLEGTVPLTIDGNSSWAEGTRALLKTQASPAQNGLFEVTTSESFGGTGKFGEGSGKFGVGSKWVLTRTKDADTTEEVKQGMFIFVTSGTANTSTSWTLTTENPIVIGTTAENFSQFTATPVGPAGGDLEGNYPKPTIRSDFTANAKGYVPCRLATNAALAAYTRTENKLEANANGALASIDGVAGVVGDYVLLKNGASGADNGVWKITSLGSAGAKWTMERPPELNMSVEVIPGMLFTIAEGTKNLDRLYQLTTNAPITINSTSLAFALVQPENWGLVEAPPTAEALINDTCVYKADKTNGIFWELVYDGEGEFPWKYVGGPPLFMEVETEQETKSKTYVNLTTTGPTVKLPALKGDFDIEVGCRYFNGTVGDYGFMSYAIGASAAEDVNAFAPLGGNNVGEAGGRPRRKTGLAASTELVAKYRVESGNAGFFRNRWMRVTPVRVG